MALRFIDSFEHYTGGSAGSVVLKWTSQLFSSIVPGGLHGKGLTGSVHKGMDFPGNVIVMECFFKGFGALFHIGDTAGRAQCDLASNTDGRLIATRFGGDPAMTLIGRTGPDLIRVNTWYHVGWKVFVDVLGSVEVRLNGEPVITVTGTDTTASTWSALLWSGAVGSFGLGDNAAGVTFDDLVVMDTVDDGIDDPRLTGGGGFDKFLGPVEIVCKYPNGAGDLAQWIPSPTVPNWQNVDDHPPDLDATFNSADRDADGTSDLFAMEDLLPDEDVVGVQSLVLARKTEEGIAGVAKLVKESGTTTVYPTVYQPNTYNYMITPEPRMPDGSLWTKARWDAIQYGYRRIF